MPPLDEINGIAWMEDVKDVANGRLIVTPFAIISHGVPLRVGRKDIMSRLVLAVFFVVGSTSLLSAAPPIDARAPTTDSFGDPLPKGAIARLGTIRWKGTERMMGIAVSPDGKFVAAICGDSRMRIWAFPSGVLLRQYQLDRPEQQATTLAFSADQKQIVLGGSMVPAARSLDLTTGKISLIGRAIGPSNPVNAHVSSNGKHVVSYENDARTCRLLLTEVARPITRELGALRMKGQIGSLRAVISPDGRWVAVTAMEANVNVILSRVYLYDTTTGKSWTSPPMTGVPTCNLAFSDDSKSFAVTSSLQMFRCEIKPPKNDGPPDVRVACNFQRLHPQGDFDVERLVFSPDGKLLIGGDSDGQIAIWDTITGKPIRHIQANPHGTVSGLVVSPDGKTLLVTNDQDATVRLFDLASGQDLMPRSGHRGAISDIAFHPSGKALATCSLNDGSLRSWDLIPKRTAIGGALVEDRIRGREYAVIEEFGQTYQNVAFADRGRLLIGSTPESVSVWDTAKAKRTAERIGVNVERRGTAFSPDGKIVALAMQDSGMALLDTATGASIANPPTSSEQIESMFFDAETKSFAAATTEGRLLTWDIATGKPLRQKADLRKGVAHRYIASYVDIDQTLIVWDRTSGRVVRRFDEFQQPHALSPDGRYLASMGPTGVILRETISSKEIQVYCNPNSRILALRFSPDGGTLAAGYADGTILLWDARPPKTKIGPDKFDGLWANLGDDNPAKAFAAMGALLAGPKEAVALLKEMLKPAPPIEPAVLARLLADLNHPKYVVREKTTKRLEAIAGQIEESLERALLRADAEAERRIERALHAIRQPIVGREQLRSFRAVAVLEWLGTLEARELLGVLAKSEGPLARDARDALARLIAR